MFKVPEWGNDVPNSNINFERTSLKKKVKQSTTQVAPESPVQTQINGVNKKQLAKKSTEKRKLKKNRQRNRELYQKLSKPQNNEAETNLNNYKPGRFVLNPNRVETTENSQTKRIKAKEPQKQKVKKQKTIVLNQTNHRNKVKKPINQKFEQSKKDSETDDIEKHLVMNETKKPQKQEVKKPKSNIKSQTNHENKIKKPIKRKLEHSVKDSEIDGIEFQNLDIEEVDEIIINAKKKKMDDAFKKEVEEDVMFSEEPRPKMNHKKERIKKILENSNRRSINLSGNPLRERMLAKLQSAQFRYLNEKLYTSSGAEAKQLFQSDPAAFETYHHGYQQQIKKWPVNPLDVIVKRIMKMPRTHLIADMGCGSGSLSQRVPHRVRSFDLVATTPAVEVCDMAHTPLLSDSMDVVVYCLALMGTELAAYLAEGNRVLKTGGHLLIAEVESRFDKLEDFTQGVERLGFKLVKTDQTHKVFYFLEFKKTQEASKKARHVQLTLKPCLYKRR